MIDEDNKTLWCGNLPEQVTEEILYELFLQAGPLERVMIPKERDGRQRNFAFITFSHEVSVPYAINLFRGTALFNRALSLQCRGGRIAHLPPPIRCFISEPVGDFPPSVNVAQKFADMTAQISNEDLRYIQSSRRQRNDDLTVASLQGNWMHRHHPYRHKDRGNVDDYRSKERNDLYKGNNLNNHSGWRENNRKKRYRRRDK